jgi:hypothetical protein
VGGAPAAPTATQRAPADSAAKQAAREATQAAEAAAPEVEAAEIAAESATEVTEVTATETTIAPEAGEEDVTWHAAATPAGLFGGGVLFFCHDLEITRSAAPTDDVAATLASPGDLDWSEVGLLALAEVQWPAASEELTDLDDLANAVFAQEPPALCAPEAYGDLWDPAAVAALPAPDSTYLTGVARLVDADAPYWIVRIGIVAEE